MTVANEEFGRLYKLCDSLEKLSGGSREVVDSVLTRGFRKDGLAGMLKELEYEINLRERREE